MRFRAVLFDAGNTLLFLDYARMAEAVGAALELPLTAEALAAGAAEAARAMERAARTDRERAAAFLEVLFRTAGVPPDRAGEVHACLARLHAERHLWAAVLPGTREALARLRGAGVRLGVVSNSDGRVEAALKAAGLREYFDVVVDSTLAGIEKPDPRIFRLALELLDVDPTDALYVGDLYEVDVLGARAAGIDAVLVGGTEPHPSGCRTAATVPRLVDDLLHGDT